MQTSTSPLLALAITGALALAACGGSDAASDTDPCDAAAAVGEAFESGDAATSPEETVEAFGDLADALDDFADAAPDEIQADVDALADAMRELARIDPEAGPNEEQNALIGSDELDAAGDRVGDYLEENCDIEI